MLVKAFSPDKAEESSKPTLVQRIVSRNNPTLFSGMQNAVNDMHSDVTYLAWLLTLDEKSLYDVTNSYILRFSGKAELQVKDENDVILAKVVNGSPVLTFDNATLPIIKGLSSTVYIGLPGNRNFSIEITKDSMLPTHADFEIEEFDSTGSSQGTIAFDQLRPHLLKSYEMFITAQKSASLEHFAEKRGRAAAVSAWQNAAAGFSVRAMTSVDSRGFLAVGVIAGLPRSYGFFEAGVNAKKSGEQAMCGTGLVLQAPLTGALAAGVMGEIQWIYTFDDDERTRFVEFAGGIVSLQPRKRVVLSLAGGANIEDGDASPALRFSIKF